MFSNSFLLTFLLGPLHFQREQGHGNCYAIPVRTTPAAQGIAAEILFCGAAVKKIGAESPTPPAAKRQAGVRQKTSPEVFPPHFTNL
jgi:hypothetical protein